MLRAGVENTIKVRLHNATGQSGYFSAWIDWNNDGDWNDTVNGTSEVLWLDKTDLQEGDNLLRFTPTWNVVSTKLSAVMRLRVSDQAGVSFDGAGGGVLLPKGEVEDHQLSVDVPPLDFGDAPDTYPTLKGKNGPRNLYDPNFHLGANLDYEDYDAQVNTGLGDDQNAGGTASGPAAAGYDDEDGVVFPQQGVDNVIYAGVENQIQVTVVNTLGKKGYLSAWVDYNGDGDFDDTLGTSSGVVTEEWFRNREYAAGSSESLTLTVPWYMSSKTTFVRFRLTEDPIADTDKGYLGPAAGQEPRKGEIEDYAVRIVQPNADFGDAEGAGYATVDVPMGTSPDSPIGRGVRHLLDSSLYLGRRVDAESNGQPSAAATGDDDNVATVFYAAPGLSAGDDEDGLRVTTHGGFLRITQPGNAQVNRLEITAHNAPGKAGYLSAWIDYNGDGDWDDAGEKVFDDVNLQDGANLLDLTVPSDVTPKYTAMRLRYGNLAALGYAGAEGVLLPQGEVEDYRVTLVTNNAEINGHKFNDFDADGVWDFNEPGKAGIPVYLDMNNNGRYEIGEPTETTSRENPDTPQSEVGYYEFANLWPGDYVVREIVPADWMQTAPYYVPANLSPALGHASIQAVVGAQLNDGETFTLGDGVKTFVFTLVRKPAFDPAKPLEVAFQPSDSAATVAASIATAVNEAARQGQLGVQAIVSTANPNRPTVVSLIGTVGSVMFRPGQTALSDMTEVSLFRPDGHVVSGWDFGNYKLGHVHVSDVSVAEGNSGTTTVQAQLHFTQSFGAPMTVSYATSDGSATLGNADYDPASGTLTFLPRSAPSGSWTIDQLTRNLTNDYNYAIWGSRVVWQGNTGSDWQIYLNDGATGITKQISHGTSQNHLASIYGDYVTWAGKASDGTDDEIFLYHITDGTVTRLTSNAAADASPQISNRYVTWWSDVGGLKQIYVYDLQTGASPINVSSNGYQNVDPRVYGSFVAWTANDGSDNEIFLYDGTRTRQLTSNYGIDDSQPHLDGRTVVYQRFDGNDYEIYAYDIATRQETQITDNAYDDTGAQVSGDFIVWQQAQGAQSVIVYYDLVGRFTPQEISGPSYPYPWYTHVNVNPRISGNRVVWDGQTGFSDNDWEIYYYEIGQSTAPENISNNDVLDGGAQISDSMVVWRSSVSGTFQVFTGVRQEPEAVVTVTLTIRGDTNVERDEEFFLNLLSSTLSTIDDNRASIGILNDDGGLDYGDAPGPKYPTLLSQDGARHQVVNGVSLGPVISVDSDGKPQAQANGDDDDGVIFNTSLIPGATAAKVTVNASVAGFLDAWIDFNGDGDWDDPQDRIFASKAVGAGYNTLEFAVPEAAVLGATAARFRFSTSGGLGPKGMAMDGEVEDYRVEVSRTGSASTAPGAPGWLPPPTVDRTPATAGRTSTIPALPSACNSRSPGRSRVRWSRSTPTACSLAMRWPPATPPWSLPAGRSI